VGRSSSRRRVATVAVVLAVAVAAAGCALGPGVRAPSVVGAPPRPCAVAAARSCALPFPSDEFTVADPSTATGRRVEIPDALFPASVLRRLGPGTSPSEAVAAADGFSAVTPIMFEFTEPVRPASLPRDGGDVLAVFDLTTGERVPIRTEVPAEAVRHGAPDTIVTAWPLTRFEFGHTYIARVSDALRTHAGAPVPAATGLARRSDPHVSSLQADLRKVEGDRWAGDAWESLRSATRFTVRSESNATSELDRMVEVVRSSDHPLRGVTVAPPVLIPEAAAVVTGEVRIDDFRDEHGVARADHGARDAWVKFVLVLPRHAAGADGAPVVIYGHGLTASKETMLFTAATNAEQGLATIGIDVPNHGDRQAGQGGYLLDIATSMQLGRLASMPLQGIVDHVSLLMAVQDHVGSLELIVPAWLDRPSSPAVALDTDTILYEGTSMGGVLGAAFVALAPEIDGAFLQVAGSGIADTIFHSVLWALFMGVVPSGATAGDAYALMGGATMLLDHADNTNLLGRIADRGTPVFLAYGVSDGVVRNEMSDRMISLLDLPLVGDQLTGIGVPFRSTGVDEVPEDGHGVAQLWPFSSAELQSVAAHLVFGQERSERLLEQWLVGRLAAEGVTP
jgi:hypothetical protein